MNLDGLSVRISLCSVMKVGEILFTEVRNKDEAVGLVTTRTLFQMYASVLNRPSIGCCDWSCTPTKALQAYFSVCVTEYVERECHNGECANAI